VAEEKPHAVCLPYPAQGHITPMLNVAKLLHARGFHVTFVNSEYNHARLVRTKGAVALAGGPGFRFATIPDGMPSINNEDDDVTQDIPTLCKSTTETCLEPFRRLLAEINGSASTEGHPPVTCVISDVIMGFSIDAANTTGTRLCADGHMLRRRPNIGAVGVARHHGRLTNGPSGQDSRRRSPPRPDGMPSAQGGHRFSNPPWSQPFGPAQRRYHAGLEPTASEFFFSKNVY
jgi:hypothetical protein